ncbi:MAG: glycosyltransferase family 4 protein [Fastidiosipilaceae bacterium]|jgi:glycosyltransferase involved in cell wall biosynthesis
MNIVVVSQIFHPVPFRVNDIVQALTAAGHEVKVVTGLPDYGLPSIPKEYRWFRKRREEFFGARVIRVPTFARRSGMLHRALNYVSFVVSGWFYMSFTNKKEVDVIFCYETSPVLQAIPAIRLKKRTKKKLVLYCLDLWPESLKAWKVEEESWFYRRMAAVSRKIYRSCNAIPVSSPGFIDYLVDVCGVPAERVSYLPQHGEDDFDSVAGVYEDNQCVDFLFAGNIGAVQSVETIIEAVSLMKTDQPFKVHIVGDGSRLEDCRRVAERGAAADKVVFHGRRVFSEMPAFYRMADCFLISLAADNAIGKTIPGKLQGYLSAGKPILASGGEEILRLLETADAGKGCEAERPDLLAALMDDCADHFEHYRLMGENGKNYFDQNFTKTVFMDRIMKILES